MPSREEIEREGLRLAGLGLRIVIARAPRPDGSCSCQDGAACKSPGKHPRFTAWQDEATTDAAQLKRAQGREACNIGVATGAVSGIFALDVDPKNGGQASLAALIAKHGPLPATWEARTGSGGSHYLFAHPGYPVTNSAGNLGPGLDIRGDGGFIVVAPSRSGVGSYSWIHAPGGPVPRATAPAWLLAALGSLPAPSVASSERGDFPPASAAVLTAARAALQALGPAVTGEGGGLHTVHAGAMLTHDYALSEEEAFPLFLEWNKTCVPPWEPDELRVMLERGRKYGKLPYGCKRPSNTMENAKLAWERYQGQASSSAERFSFEPATDLLTRVVASLVWFIIGLLPEKSVLVIAGEPKTSKTWLALTMAIAVSSRRALFNVFKVPGNERSGVAYFALEDSEQSFRTRLSALARGMDLDPLEAVRHIHVRCRGSLDLLDDDDLCGLLAACPANLALLVIDPLRDAHTGEENSSGDMAEVMKRLRFLRDTLGCSVLFVHHSAKASPDKAQRRPGQLMRGSSAVHGAVDGGIYLAMTKATAAEWVNTVVVELKAGRGAGTFGLTLSVEDDANGEARVARWTYSREAKTAPDAEELGAGILVALSEKPDSGSGLARRLGRRLQAVLQACTELEQEGLIVKTGHRWHTPSQASREAPEAPLPRFPHH